MTPIAEFSIPDNIGDTLDVGDFGGEWGGNRSLGFRQGYPSVGHLQRPTIIGTIPTHTHIVPENNTVKIYCMERRKRNV